MDTEETDVQEDQGFPDIETLSGDEPDIPETEETEPEEEESPVYMEDVKEMVFRRRTDISDLQEKLGKYQEKIEDEILTIQSEIRMLDRVANALPPRPIGPLFGPENGVENPLPQPMKIEEEDEGIIPEEDPENISE
jgi:hypothetical protein